MQELGTSESTVRRDLDELEAASKLRQVHGGAESFHFLQEEESNKEKSIKNIQVKSSGKAAELIKDHDVIFIDAGTTNELWYKKLSINGNCGDQFDSPCDQVGRKEMFRRSSSVGR